MSDAPAPILYCHCAWAKIVPAETKAEVLRRLAAADVPFEAVPDLCEMSAKKDPALARHAATAASADGGLRIVACYPRAVRWLYHAAGTPLPEGVEVRNMRTEEPEQVADRALRPAGDPLPADALEEVADEGAAHPPPSATEAEAVPEPATREVSE